MKQRFSTHTTLIELTLSLLFLMLSSVTILGLFMTAHEKSVLSGQMTQAVQLAQDTAALIAGSDDVRCSLEENGHLRMDEDVFLRETDEGLQLKTVLGEEQTEVGMVLRAQVSVCSEGQVLTEWPVSRYYNKEVIHP